MNTNKIEADMQLAHLQTKPAWQFWHPESGMLGGIVFGVITTAVGISLGYIMGSMN